MDNDVKDICDRLLDVPVPRLLSSVEMVDRARRARRCRHARFAVAGAGLAVVAVAVTVAAVPLAGGPGAARDTGVGAATASTAPASPSPSPSAQTSRDLGREVRAVKMSTVITEMVARAAEVRPLSVANGQLLYVRTESRDPLQVEGTRTDPSRQSAPPDLGGRLHQMWLDPQGMIMMLVDTDGGLRESTPDAALDATRQQFAQEGPSLRMPSPQWLATLPTDPVALLREVDALNAGTKLGGKRYEFKEISELLWKCGAVLTPRVRAAFYSALGRISGVTATELRVDGRRLYALRQPDNGRGFAQELLLDPATGQVVGERSVEFEKPDATPVGLSLWRYAAVGGVGEPG